GEDTSLSVSGALTITDADAGEAVFQAVSGAASTNGYGTFDVDASGNWTYTLDNTNAAVQGLGAGDMLAGSFTVTTADGTTQLVTVTINGTNDAPVIGGVTSGEIGRASCRGGAEVPAVAEAVEGEAVFQAVSGAASTNGYGTFDVDASGNWTYTLDNTNAAVQGLGGEETPDVSFTVPTADGTTQLVTVTINGTNDAPVIGGVTSGAVSEDTSLSVSGALTITDADAGEAVFQAVSGEVGRARD